MPFPPSRSPSHARRWLPWLVLLVGGLAGCQGEGITQYRVPHEDDEGPPARVRVLAAVLPHDKDAWFFKLAGPIDAVGAETETFESVVKSARFPDKGDKPITWKTPEGWKEKPGNEFLHATLESPKGNLSLTISKLPLEKANLEANVNRWRQRDLGLPPVQEGDLAKFTREIQVEGAAATLVDMTGPGARKGAHPGGMGQAGRRPPVRQPGPLPLTYEAPKGWEQLGPQGAFTLDSFQISEGDQKAKATITPPGIGGSVAANLTRWRQQVGLGAISDEEVAKMNIATLPVDGLQGKYFDLAGPAGPNQQRMLVVLVERKGKNWFFKLLGNADLVSKQKANFESFVKSVKFTGAADE